MSGITGLEVLFSVIKKDLKSTEDCAVAAIHWLLIKSGLLCVGIGEDFSDNDVNTATELVPECWNENQDMYCLRYRGEGLKNCYLLKISKTGCNLHINFGEKDDNLVSMTIRTNDFATGDFSNFSHAFKSLNELKNQVEEVILKDLKTKKKSSSSKKESSKKKASSKNEPNQESPKIESPQYQPVPVGVPDSRQPQPFAFPQIGGSDLDPLGRGQGGMLFDPFSSGGRSPFGGPGIGPFGGGRFGSGNTGLPPGAIPPGARFDPFSPITPNRFNPDPDHFRPPDYDNMFM